MKITLSHGILYPYGIMKLRHTLSIRQYFDLCDGIFLNYHWTMADLKNSHSLASHRNLDVFVGIDVFGRGCFGGGGYNCNMVRVYA